MKIKIQIAFLLVLSLAACGGDEKKTDPDNNGNKQDSAVTKKDTTTTEVAHRELDKEDLGDFFYSPKVNELVESKPAYGGGDMDMDYTYDFLTKKELDKLTARELVYYCIKYPCSFEQICAEGFHDTTATPKIFGDFFFDESGVTMSSLQTEALDNRRDSVIVLLNTYLEQKPKKIDTDCFYLLQSINSTENIPLIVETASLEHLDNYTYLVALLKSNDYKPFEETAIYKELFSDDAAFRDVYVEATEKNRDIITRLAMDFYKQANNK